MVDNRASHINTVPLTQFDEKTLVAGDAGLSRDITEKLEAVEKGVLTKLPTDQVELLQRILVAQLAIVAGIADMYSANPETYIAIGASLAETDA